MIQKLQFYISESTDPYENLAVEQYLADSVEVGCCILYLWQNENTVVIGKNQNPWAECRCTLLEEEGGKLARRHSGGGAVFHDIGNLNYTFLCQTEDFDMQKNLQVIQAACALSGIRAEISGRNDLLADGKKFSGSAFYHAGGKSYQHGTLLISADMNKLARYLTPPKAKLEAKGVASVGARVINLSALASELTCKTMRTNMLTAFLAAYNMHAKNLAPLPQEVIAAHKEVLESWDWRYGSALPFSVRAEAQFTWGHMDLRLKITRGVIEAAQCYTDAMEHNLAEQLTAALTGCKFTADAVRSALAAVSHADDITKMLIKKTR